MEEEDIEMFILTRQTDDGTELDSGNTHITTISTRHKTTKAKDRISTSAFHYFQDCSKIIDQSSIANHLSESPSSFVEGTSLTPIDPDDMPVWLEMKEVPVEMGVSCTTSLALGTPMANFKKEEEEWEGEDENLVIREQRQYVGMARLSSTISVPGGCSGSKLEIPSSARYHRLSIVDAELDQNGRSKDSKSRHNREELAGD
jgi:hypothetical protein